MSDRLRWDTAVNPGDWGYPAGEFGHYEAAYVVPGIQCFIPTVLDRLGVQPGDHVLDIGCGTGVATLEAAARVGRAGRVVGLDRSPHMLSIAQRKPPLQPDAATIEWSEGDALALPFPDAAFDAVCCVLVVHLIDDRVAALREMLRVLRSGGRVVVMTWGAIERSPGQSVMRDTWVRHFGDEQRWLCDAQHALSDPRELHDLLVAAGFGAVAVEPVLGTARYDSPEMLARAYGTSLEIDADERTRAQIFEEVAQALQAYVGPDGLKYPIEAIVASAQRRDV